MIIHFELGKNEVPTNFNVAEAVLRVCSNCNSRALLNAEVVAKMILLQIESMKGGE